VKLRQQSEDKNKKGEKSFKKPERNFCILQEQKNETNYLILGRCWSVGDPDPFLLILAEGRNFFYRNPVPDLTKLKMLHTAEIFYFDNFLERLVNSLFHLQ
jgi:hypothetical protein